MENRIILFMAPNHHVAPAVAEILNSFAAQTPYKVDDLESYEPGLEVDDADTERWNRRHPHIARAAREYCDRQREFTPSEVEAIRRGIEQEESR